jgi:hypothetical protein
MSGLDQYATIGLSSSVALSSEWGSFQPHAVVLLVAAQDSLKISNSVGVGGWKWHLGQLAGLW